jgi:hypothetical protein
MKSKEKITQKELVQLFKDIEKDKVKALRKFLELYPKQVDVWRKGNKWILDKTPLMHALGNGSRKCAKLLVSTKLQLKNAFLTHFAATAAIASNAASEINVCVLTGIV